MTLKRLDKSDFKKLMGVAPGEEVNQNHLMLRFLDFNFHPDHITKTLGLEPESISLKGEVWYPGGQMDKPKVRECSSWNYESTQYSNEFIGGMINSFFQEILVPKLDLIKEIGNNCEIVKLILVQYYYTSHNPGYGFEKEQI